MRLLGNRNVDLNELDLGLLDSSSGLGEIIGYVTSVTFYPTSDNLSFSF